MKAITIVIAGILVGFSASAQTQSEKSNYPYQTISKDVQKLQYRNIEHMPAKIVMSNPAMTQTKGTAQLLSKQNNKQERILVRVGYPAWTISKPVARRQYERSQSR